MGKPTISPPVENSFRRSISRIGLLNRYENVAFRINDKQRKRGTRFDWTRIIDRYHGNHPCRVYRVYRVSKKKKKRKKEVSFLTKEFLRNRFLRVIRCRVTNANGPR